MLDTLGFHTNRDYQAELHTIRAEIRALTNKVTDGRFYSYEDRHNTHARLNNLHRQANTLTREAAMEDQRLNRLNTAVRTAGDIDLALIAYVVFGPSALPMAALYEVRLVDEDGYTVPSCVRTNLPADRVERARREFMTVDGPAYARMLGRRFAGYRVQITPF